MEEAAFPILIPGTPIAPDRVLARYRSPTSATFIQAALEATTAPGDLIMELGIGAATYVREILEMKRRALALNINPIPLLWTHIALESLPFAEVQAALTRLGDLPKGKQPLIAYIREIYRSRCPTCQTVGMAEWFAWDRDAQRPFAKRVRCPRCPEPQEGVVDTQDIAILEQFPRGGPAYHIALGRAAGIDDPLRERAAELVALYTPRNLSALMDVINRLPQTTPTMQRLLTLLVIAALDEGSHLIAYEEPLSRPRSLRPAPRYLENNIWLVMENALTHYSAHPTLAVGVPADSLKTLLASDGGTYLLSSQPLQGIVPALPRQSIAALLIQPQAPDAIFWALSALWSTWLWKDAIHPFLRAFVGRRRLDWIWYQRSLILALKRIIPYLKPRAPLLIVLPDDDPTALAHIVAATAQAGLQVKRWLACSPQGYRLALTTEDDDTALPSADQEYLTHVLRQRGEPTAGMLLNAAYLIAARESAPARLELGSQVIHAPPFTDITPKTIWMPSPTRVAKPLADRVEEYVLRLLQSQEQWEQPALEQAVYAQFHSELSPEPALVTACCAAYTTVDVAGKLRLRAEDLPAARGAETRQIRGLLRQLGERLHFSVSQTPEWDVIWADGDKILYMFRCTTTAVLATHLLVAHPPSEARRVLVLPGGRAALVALKLKRDPRWQKNIGQDNWGFIKFRHLRRMAAEITQRADIEVYLGLDPIVEQSKVQIPLPWK